MMIYSYCRESENLKSFFFSSLLFFLMCECVCASYALENRAQCGVWEEGNMVFLFSSFSRVAVHRRGVPNGYTEEERKF